MTNRSFKVKKLISERKNIYNKYNSLGITIFWVPTASSRGQIRDGQTEQRGRLCLQEAKLRWPH